VLVVVAPIEGQSRAVLPLLLSQWLRRVRGLHRRRRLLSASMLLLLLLLRWCRG
jgi:hypothetical protein